MSDHPLPRGQYQLLRRADTTLSLLCVALGLGAAREHPVQAALLVVLVLTLIWGRERAERVIRARLSKFAHQKLTTKELPTHINAVTEAWVTGIPLALAFLLIALALHAIPLRGTTVGGHLEEAGYALIRRTVAVAAKDECPVVVIDLSDERLDQSDPDVPPVVSRKRLGDFVHRVATLPPAVRPKVVGIDVDFTNDDTRPKEDPATLARWQKLLAGSEGGPDRPFALFIGVYNVPDRPREWLYTEEGQSLAGWMGVRQNDVGHLPAEIRFPERELPPPLAFALARAYRPAVAEEVSRMGWPFALWRKEQVEDEKESARVRGEMKSYLVDFTWLDRLRARQGRSLSSYLDDPEADFGDLSGKIVLLGNVSAGRYEDVFIVPGEARPVPGVYVHACGAATLASQRPIRHVHPMLGAILDALLVILVLAWFTGVRGWAAWSGRDVSAVALPWVFAVCAVATAITGLALAYLRVYWPDFLLAALLLAFHPFAEHTWKVLTHGAKRPEPNTPVPMSGPKE